MADVSVSATNVTIIVPTFTDVDTFFAPASTVLMTVIIKPPTLNNAYTILPPAVSPRTLSVVIPAFINVSTFFAPTVDPQSGYAPVVVNVSAIPSPTAVYEGSIYPIVCLFSGQIGLPVYSANLLAQPGLWVCDGYQRSDGWINWPHTKPPFDIGYPSSPKVQ